MALSYVGGYKALDCKEYLSKEAKPSVLAAPSPSGQWLTPGVFALLLGGMIFAVFPQVITGLHSFVFRDYSFFGYPLAHYYRESFWQGELPLWNPYNNCGLPFLAQWGTMVLYPPSLIYLLLPLPWSLGMFSLLHLFFGGLGMYVLCWKWTGNRLAAAVAGIGFPFSGLVVNCLMWPNYTATLAWMPWVVWSVSKAWQEGGCKRIILASAIGTMQMLSGTPEVILFTWIILGVLCFTTPMDSWTAVMVRGRRFGSVVILIAALAAAQLLPFFELLANSERTAAYDRGRWPVPLWGVANLFVPVFRTFAAGSGVHFQPQQAFTSSYYSGLPIMLFGLAALFWLRDRRTRLLMGLVIGSFVLAMGEPAKIYGWLRTGFPATGFMRYTSKLTLVSTFIWPVLAAFGLAAWFSFGERALARRRTILMLSVVFVMAAGSVALVAYQYPPRWERWQHTVVNAAVRVTFLIGCLGAIYWLAGAADARRRRLGEAAVLFVIWADLAMHTPNQNPTLIAEAISMKLGQSERLSPPPGLGESRAALTIQAFDEFQHSNSTNLAATYVCVRYGLFGNINLTEKIPKADGFYALFLSNAREVERKMFLTKTSFRPPLARFMGVSQVPAASNATVWLGSTNYMPMITAGQRPIFTDAKTTIAGLMDTNFTPESVVYLPLAASNSVCVAEANGAQVLSYNVRAHRIGAQIEARAPSLVVLAQSDYPAWRAFVNGKPAQIWRANHAFQAVQVTAGKHNVELVYRDRKFAFGALLSLLAGAGCVLVWRSERGARTQPGETQPSVVGDGVTSL